MLKEYLGTLANAFRTALGTTDKINAQDFANKVGVVYEKGKAEGGGGSGLPNTITEIKSGNFTVASDTTDGQYVEISMSEAPTTILLWADKDVQELYTHLFIGWGAPFSFVGTSNLNRYFIHHGTNATGYSGNFRTEGNGGFTDITKDGFMVHGYTRNSFYFRAGITYHWLAWR
jgi:hypothetical protein